jgi:hypothetical protein
MARTKNPAKKPAQVRFKALLFPVDEGTTVRSQTQFMGWSFPVDEKTAEAKYLTVPSASLPPLTEHLLKQEQAGNMTFYRTEDSDEVDDRFRNLDLSFCSECEALQASFWSVPFHPADCVNLFGHWIWLNKKNWKLAEVPEAYYEDYFRAVYDQEEYKQMDWLSHKAIIEEAAQAAYEWSGLPKEERKPYLELEKTQLPKWSTWIGELSPQAQQLVR